MRIPVACIAALATLLLGASSWSDSRVTERQVIERRVMENLRARLPAQLWRTRPVRRDLPLRAENISDREVTEIETVMKKLYPGSIVYISAVTTGCPCEDGPDCTDQVWSVAGRKARMSGIALSRIEDKWQVGPLQSWWLIRDRIEATYRRSRNDPDADRRMSADEYMRRMREHDEAFPWCVEGDSVFGSIGTKAGVSGDPPAPAVP